MAENKERHNLFFNTEKPLQKEAHEYLSKLGKSQSKVVSMLIHNLLVENGVTDVTTLTPEEAKALKPNGYSVSGNSSVERFLEAITKAVEAGGRKSEAVTSNKNEIQKWSSELETEKKDVVEVHDTTLAKEVPVIDEEDDDENLEGAGKGETKR